ncbi:MAG: hypothetical protein M1826_004068 [Phylliscum demangeonii]|nr:MAG: hypothetical protein M1826_004068 [Phylliscum demangeonii]
MASLEASMRIININKEREWPPRISPPAKLSSKDVRPSPASASRASSGLSPTGANAGWASSGAGPVAEGRPAHADDDAARWRTSAAAPAPNAKSVLRPPAQREPGLRRRQAERASEGMDDEEEEDEVDGEEEEEAAAWSSMHDMLHTRSIADLQALLSNSALLAALAQTAAPAAAAAVAELGPQLTHNLAQARTLQQRAHALQRTHQHTQAHLLQLHARERAFHAAQAALDQALAPRFRAQAFYPRLVAAVVEEEAAARGVEEDFLEGAGAGAVGRGAGAGAGAGPGAGRYADEGEVLAWLKRYRERRERYWRRVEEKARWDEGRVCGWR